MAGTDPRDSDGDGVPNHLDLDSDNDGKSDASEASAFANTVLDTDGDGIPDSVDVSQTNGDDADDDGIDDRFDASFIIADDTDGDGIIDSADPDANGDGLADDTQNVFSREQALPDTNGNGIVDIFDADTGLVRTGLDGFGGCSIGDPTGNRGSFDPLFTLMISAIAIIAWRRRARCSR